MFGVFKRKKEERRKDAEKPVAYIDLAEIEARRARKNEGRVVSRDGFDSFALFCRAVVYNDLDAVKRMLDDGYDANMPYGDVDGCYPLDVAARFGTLEAVELLLEAGASPFGVFEPGEDFFFYWTPWGRAIQEGRVDVFRAMLKHCDFLHMFNSRGTAAVETCFGESGRKNAEIISALLDAGFDPRSYRSEHGNNTFLQTLILYCYNQDALKKMLERVKEYGLTFNEVPVGSAHRPPLIMLLNRYNTTPELAKLAFQNSRFAIEEPEQ